jgi:uncharacterized RDD family membrane protein YckC
MPNFPSEATHVTGRRIVAQLLDWFVLVPALIGIDALVGGALNWVATAFVLLFYFGWLQGMSGWTVGKLVAGIRVVDRSGLRPGPDAGLKRALPLLFEWWGLFALVLMLRSPWRQRAGDRWAGTYVVPARLARAPLAA